MYLMNSKRAESKNQRLIIHFLKFLFIVYRDYVYRGKAVNLCAVQVFLSEIDTRSRS